MINLMEFQYIIRLVIAAVCGGLIGYERKNRSKVAGVRTHCVVACASAMMMILSKYAYFKTLVCISCSCLTCLYWLVFSSRTV